MSTQAITALRQKKEARIQVYNPSMYTDAVDAAGQVYHFEPRGYARCACAHHNIPGREDNLGVHASYDWPRDKKNVLLVGGQRKVGADGELTADTVAELIVSERASKHFVIVEGTQGERDAIVREADRKWHAAHIEDVEQTIVGWERECRELQALQPGAQPPRQPPRVQEAYRFRRMWNTAVEDRGAYVCMTCGFDAKTKADLDEHVVDEHPAIAAERGLVRGLNPAPPPPPRPARSVPSLSERTAATNERDAARAAEDGPENEPPPGDGPGAEVAPAGEGDAPDPEDEQETGEVLMKRAERTGVVLSVADRKGLVHDDKDVMEDVRGRISDLRKQRAEQLKANLGRRKGAPATT